MAIITGCNYQACYPDCSSLKEGFKAQKTSQGRTNSPKAAVSAVSTDCFLSVAVSQDQTNVHFFVALLLVSFFFFLVATAVCRLPITMRSNEPDFNWPRVTVVSLAEETRRCT